MISVIECSSAHERDHLRKAKGMRDMRIQRTGADESPTLRLGENFTDNLRRGHNPNRDPALGSLALRGDHHVTG